MSGGSHVSRGTFGGADSEISGGSAPPLPSPASAGAALVSPETLSRHSSPPPLPAHPSHQQPAPSCSSHRVHLESPLRLSSPPSVSLGGSLSLQPVLFGPGAPQPPLPPARHPSRPSASIQNMHIISAGDALATTLSALYGKLLVVMGVAFPMAEVISTYIPPSFYEVRGDALATTLSALYGKLLVVMGVAFPMAEVISTYIPPSFYEKTVAHIAFFTCIVYKTVAPKGLMLLSITIFLSKLNTSKSDIISPDPKHSRIWTIALAPEGILIYAVALTPEWTPDATVALNNERSQTLVIALKPELSQTLVIALKPELSQTLVIALKPELSQTLVIALKPELSQTLVIALTPERTSDATVTLKPERSQTLVIALTPERTPDATVALKPERSQTLVIALTPERTRLSLLNLSGRKHYSSLSYLS
ncbi:Protein FAM186A [Papilio xuthus]|uniref:Protein FAM186A n=1 Tax=Papilio xuthus TaxID=66420 RepID=A0A194PCZ6_PAPXU|nr:Protein FAM186A [Papilio xuthus]